MESPNFFAILHPHIRYNKNISDFQKIICAEITALMNKSGYCYASNQYFAEMFEKNDKYISWVLNDLKIKGIIDIIVEKNYKRKIFIIGIEKLDEKIVFNTI